MVLNFTACKDSTNDGNSSYYTDNDLTIKMGGRTTFHNIKESDIENTSFPFSSAHYIYAYLDSEEFSNNIRHISTVIPSLLVLAMIADLYYFVKQEVLREYRALEGITG